MIMPPRSRGGRGMRIRGLAEIRDEMSTAEAQREERQADVQGAREAGPAVAPAVAAGPPPELYQAVAAIWAAMQGRAGQAQVPPVQPVPQPAEPQFEYGPEMEPAAPEVRAVPRAEVQAPQAQVRETARLPIQVSKLLKEARQLGCVGFDGFGDVSVAQRWLESVTRVAKRLRLSEEDKVTLATCLLENEAETWWDSIQARFSAVPSWEEFAHEFNEQYYTQFHRDQMVVEFYHLTQGTRTVTEYEAELRRLSRFVPDSERTDSLLAHKFEEGLNMDIRAAMGTPVGQGLRTLITMAGKAERVVAGQRAARGTRSDLGGRQSRFRRRFEFRSGARIGPYPPVQSRFQASSSQAPRMRPAVSVQASSSASQSRPQVQTGLQRCRNCDRVHAPPCTQPIRCFACGRTGHMARECPSVGSQGPVVQFRPFYQMRPRGPETQSGSQGSVRPASRQTVAGQSSGRSVGRPPQRPQTRLFTLADAEAIASPDVVAGTASLFSRVIRVLFDPGSSRSFVGPRVSEFVDRPLKSLDPPIVVTTPLGEQLVCEFVYPGCVMSIGSVQLEVNLIPLDLRDFDVIVGMDCLSRYRARMECHSKRVWFSLSDGTEAVFSGDRPSVRTNMISWMSARRLIRTGCTAFLAHVRDTTSSTSSVPDVPVVQEFPDVFPEDLPGVPPDREIEFEIE